jgi:hypothetical protein
MANKTKKLNDEEILAVINAGVREGVRFTDSKLAKVRRQVTQYYDGKLPAPLHSGNSSYVSTDVFDSVEAMKATLTETFSASSDIIQFSAKGEEDVEQARIATAYTKHVVFEQNCGTDIIHDTIHDGLTAYLGVAQVYWDKCYDKIEETFEDLDMEALDLLLSDEEVTPDEIEQDMETGLFSGRLTRNIDKSQVRIEVIPPEEFIVNPNIKKLEDSPFVSRRMEKSKSDLLKEKYPKSKVNELKGGDNTLEMDEERITRFDGVANDYGRSGDLSQEETKLLIVYETYGEISAEGDGIARMYRVVHCQNVILEKEQVDRLPFFTFRPLSTPHSFFGTNFAARVIPTQNAKTVLTRSILDHAVIANNPRYGVVKGALTNPRELLDNRVGGIVNMTRQDGVFPLPQANLNPFVFETIKMLDTNKEDVTGVSRLSQGLNKDAISSQNSEGMVENLIGASMQRQKTIARNFATQFLAPLFLEVYRLVVENEKSQRIIDIAGAFAPVTPSSWRKQRDVSIDFRLGYGERDRIAQEYLMIHQQLANDPAIQHLYGPEQRYNLYKSALETKGHKNVAAFLANPQEVEPPGPDPLVEVEIEERKSNIDISQRKQKMAEEKTINEFKLNQLTQDFNNRFKTLEYTLSVMDQERKDLETQNRIEVSIEEMALAREAQEKAPEANTKSSAIISPNG